MTVKDTEATILNAATRVFLEHGLSGARMQEIADAAGINKALLHYYFRSKERLYQVVLEHQVGQVFRGLFAALNQTGSFEDWLRSFIRYYLTTISQHPSISRLLIWELSGDSCRVPDVIRKVFANDVPQGTNIKEIVRSSLISGGYDKVDPVHFLISLLSLCVYPIIAKPIISSILPEAEMDSPEFLNTREDAVFRLIIGGIKDIQASNDHGSKK